METKNMLRIVRALSVSPYDWRIKNKDQPDFNQYDLVFFPFDVRNVAQQRAAYYFINNDYDSPCHTSWGSKECNENFIRAFYLPCNNDYDGPCHTSWGSRKCNENLIRAFYLSCTIKVAFDECYQTGA